jgi:hypothetical protein
MAEDLQTGVIWRKQVRCKQGHVAGVSLATGYSNLDMGSRTFCVHCNVVGPYDMGIQPDIPSGRRNRHFEPDRYAPDPRFYELRLVGRFMRWMPRLNNADSPNGLKAEKPLLESALLRGSS